MLSNNYNNKTKEELINILNEIQTNIDIDLYSLSNYELIEYIERLNYRINILEYENREQKIEINKLKDENREQKIEINNLKEENKEQTIKINKLEEQIINLNYDNINLKNRLEIKDIKEIRNNFIVMLQDLNSYGKLEKKYNNQELLELRNNRLSECHFIKDIDTHEIINYKMKLILNELLKININIKKYFIKKYDNIIDDVFIDYLKKNITDVMPNSKECQKAEEWIKEYIYLEEI
jgi:hypothetical protein